MNHRYFVLAARVLGWGRWRGAQSFKGDQKANRDRRTPNANPKHSPPLPSLIQQFQCYVTARYTQVPQVPRYRGSQTTHIVVPLEKRPSRLAPQDSRKVHISSTRRLPFISLISPGSYKAQKSATNATHTMQKVHEASTTHALHADALDVVVQGGIFVQRVTSALTLY